jgi:glycosyltransferase involved in cell wall biosynthesis
MEWHNNRALTGLVERFGPDAVSVWNMGGMSLGLLSWLYQHNVPTVLAVCDEWPVYAPSLDAWLRPLTARPAIAKLVRLLTGLPTTWPPLGLSGSACFASSFLLNGVRGRSRWEFAGAKVVHPGIDPEDFPRVPDVDRPWRWRLSYVGRIDRCKDIATVVRALAHCPPEASLVVHGRGDDGYLAELQELAAELGLGDRVAFTASSRGQVASVYREVDVVIFSSTCGEGFGLVPIEAMACARPVVATRDGGSAEYLEVDKNCLAFGPGDAVALGGALARLAEDDELRRTLVTGGLLTAATFTVERQAAGLERELQALAAKAGPRGR